MAIICKINLSNYLNGPAKFGLFSMAMLKSIMAPTSSPESSLRIPRLLYASEKLGLSSIALVYSSIALCLSSSEMACVKYSLALDILAAFSAAFLLWSISFFMFSTDIVCCFYVVINKRGWVFHACGAYKINSAQEDSVS